MPRKQTHAWEFKARFRRRAFGWRSQPAVLRVRQAVTEIKRVARRDRVLGAEGAVIFLERVSPALEQVDSSSGAVGTAVNRAIEELVPIIADAPVDEETRDQWLERLFQAHAEDEIPYVEILADFWGDLCASAELASRWADRLLEVTRMAMSPDPDLRGYYHGTPACFSALYRAGRYREILELLAGARHSIDGHWGVRALAALGRPEEALAFARTCRGGYGNDGRLDDACAEILLSQNRVDEAYQSDVLRGVRGGTYVATFRASRKRYPGRPAAEVLADLVATTPGLEGKWFAAAKDAELYAEALVLATQSPCDPKTLARAARDYAESRPAFAMEAGRLALQWLGAGHGYEITGLDVHMAYGSALAAAERLGQAETFRSEVRGMIHGGDSFLGRVLGRELGIR